MCDDFKISMMLKFDMCDLGRVRYFLGVEILQNAHGIFIVSIWQEGFNVVKNPIVLGTRLSRNGAGAKVDATLFKQVVGSLVYLTVTQPELMYGVSLYKKWESTIYYINRDFTIDIGDRKSTFGFMFFLGFGVVSWSFKKQSVVTLSTIEVEYIVVASYACQCI